MTREEIIKGLGKIGDFFRARANMAVGDGKMLLLNWMKCAEEAAEAMRAQEPRVLSVADIIDEHITPDIIWVERRHENDICPGVWQIDHYEMGLGGVLDDLGEEIAERPDAYNTLWRCWTSRPTDEQREATPWLNMS